MGIVLGLIVRGLAMLRRLFCYVAGIDRHTLAGCPITDKLWATHLGFSLTLSFLVVLGISFHASGYVILDPWMRAVTCTVIALTIFMFDRALYQSDWFYQGIFRIPRTVAENVPREANWNLVWRILRVSIRLIISVGLATVLSVFVELAVFSDTITEKIKTDFVDTNKPIFEKVAQYEARLDAEIQDRYAAIKSLENQIERELKNEVALDPAAQAQFNYYSEQKRLADSRESELRQQLRSVQGNIRKYKEDMNAEELGQKLRDHNSGLLGRGPRFEFAKKQTELYEREQSELEDQLAELDKKREGFTQAQNRIANDSVARRNRDQIALKEKREELERKLAGQNDELKTLQAMRNGKVESFRSNALAAPEFQKLKNDPLSRMTAYQHLKQDHKDGETITKFSWMTKFLIIFLEVVPVVAKMFFSPPSVYAAKIQAEVEKARLDTEKEVLERERQVVEQETVLQREREAYAEAQRERENADLRHGMVQDTFNKARDAGVTEFPHRSGASGER